MPRVLAKARKWMGPQAIDWATDHPAKTTAMRDRGKGAGWDVQTATVILLALAEEARATLAAQTGGEAPTMRSVLYLLMATYGVTKSAYGPLGDYTTRARKRAYEVLPRD